MKFYGPLESLLDYSPQGTSRYLQLLARKDENSTPSLEGLLQEKVTCLADILGQIEGEIRNRNDLSGKVIDRIYQHYCYLKSGLIELYTWQLGINRGIEIRRVRLEKQLDTLLQEKRLEQIKCWQDVAKLRKEQRTWFKQYCDLAQRLKIIFPDQKTEHGH